MKRILVVDDDVRAAKALGTLLQMDDFDVAVVTVSGEALERLRTERFDAVITDLEMPGHHGLEVVRAATALQPRPAVFVVTGYVDSPATRSALATGAQRLLYKPVAYDDLLAAVRASLPHP